MAVQLRGLTTFIADIRNCKSQEEEQKRVDAELHKIRTKFLNAGKKKLDSYSLKKYLLKLCFISQAGYDIDFGHIEAVNLLSGSKFSEKTVGYLFAVMAIDPAGELVRLIINSIRNDLLTAGKSSSHDVSACLALAAVANIGGKEMAEALAPVVQELLFSPETTPMVKKKAALCLLRLFRAWPEMLSASEVAEPLTRLLDARHLGVATGALSLLTSLVSHDPDGYAGCVRQCVWLLDKLALQGEAKPAYYYYDVPAPWLQVKLLRLLQYYPAPEDRNMQARLVQVLGAILSRVETDARPNHVHAVQAVLFEAMDLVIHLDIAPELIIQCANLLGKFVTSKVTNTRYLGLAKMAHLAAANHDAIELIRRHQKTIMSSLRDADISIRRRAMDLLFAMCDSSNSEEIVTELLDYLDEAEFEIKDELVLKIAILAEKYAPHPNWYFDTVLTLISAGRDHVSDDIWYRAVQVVTNNEDMQPYAAQRVFDELCSPSAHEVAVKIAGYVLGEYGHFIADAPGSSPTLMFNLLHSKFSMVGSKTKALLLTAYSKLVNLFPELKLGVEAVLEQHRSAMDADIQQRACEYMVLSTAQEPLLNVVWEVMPAFPERESAVVIYARKLEEAGKTDRGPTHAAEEEDLDAVLAQVGAAAGAAVPAATPAAAPVTSAPPPSSGSLLDLMSEPTAPAPAPAATGKAATGGELVIDNPDFVGALKFANVGILFEDADIKVGYKGEFKNNLARVTLFFMNLTGSAMSPFAATALEHESFNVSVPEALTSVPAGASQAAQIFLVETAGVFSKPLVVQVAYNGENLFLMLPLFPSKFLAPLPLDGPGFLGQWNAVAADAQKMVVMKPHAGAAASPAAVSEALTALNFGILQGVDPSPTNVVAAAMWCSTAVKAAVLVRVEVAAQHGLYRLTFRCGEAKVAGEVCGAVARKIGVVQA
ncbi:AP-2 complex subunit alpha-2 [Thecamonas trahens ATCC 50062]|uniref:AP-2 complex subunit alpha n=1 Tax=Thecamonas trahens ATCC 50062 TaxID=461836 RepID=A0A0L0D9B3_THETB|nr:AP-2 complex subunit alpha-2 [Thecamonas trahens ATCC 50062]KNC48830.1 AP-2 complex subunit alpha-2 [Thecamonas trahens ATCC 50062]|eukprot:XP_013758250.1 AP-2 complex subunit alpha-2 [Thecamonas trahens ATCC 50062]